MKVPGESGSDGTASLAAKRLARLAASAPVPVWKVCALRAANWSGFVGGLAETWTRSTVQSVLMDFGVQRSLDQRHLQVSK